MGTGTVLEAGLIVKISPEILGPGSEYAERHIALRKEWLRVVEDAKGIRVTDAASAEMATQAGRVLQAATKEVEQFFKPVKQQIDALKKPVLADENADMQAIVAEKNRLGAEITSWNAGQEKIRQEAERAAREEAERLEREALLARAVELEGEGNVHAAEALLEEPVVPVVVIQASAPPKVSGQVGKITYGCAVTNLRELAKAVAEGKISEQAICPNHAWLNNKARLDKESFSVPGCTLTKESSTHFRS